MKIKYLNIFAALLLCLFAAGCSSDDGYNADTAESYYVPEAYDKMVSAITMTQKMADGKDCEYIYEFLYDAQNRIKEVNSKWKFFPNIPGIGKKLCNAFVCAKYYYDASSLTIKCRQENLFPGNEDWNSVSNQNYSGAFNKDGVLAQFNIFDCEYQGMLLKKAYVDGGEEFELKHDRNNNIISAYRLDSLGNAEEGARKYSYSQKINKTNFDFASFFGYNIIEAIVYYPNSAVYAPFQLGAFGMFGARGINLPDGEWEMDSEGYPVTYSNSEGRKYVITYKE
jgi:hypothetical protein